MVTMASPHELPLKVRDGQYIIETSGDRSEDWPDTQDGLLTGEESWMAVLTGTDWGPVRLAVHELPTAPGSVSDGWEMVAERDLINDGTRFGIRDLYGDEPVFELEAPPGRYRVRVHVRGRAAAAAAGDVDSPVEDHLIQFWPAHSALPAATLVGPDSAAADLM